MFVLSIRNGSPVVRLGVMGALFSLALLLSTIPGFAAKPGGNIATTDIVQMEVVPDVCELKPEYSSCPVGPDSGQPAADGNTVPIKIVVNLMDPTGTPISGLVEGDFTIQDLNGTPVAKVIGSFSNLEVQFGTADYAGAYRFFIEPAASWTWDGDNTYRLRVEPAPGRFVYYLFQVSLRP